MCVRGHFFVVCRLLLICFPSGCGILRVAAWTHFSYVKPNGPERQNGKKAPPQGSKKSATLSTPRHQPRRGCQTSSLDCPRPGRSSAAALPPPLSVAPAGIDEVPTPGLAPAVLSPTSVCCVVPFTRASVLVWGTVWIPRVVLVVTSMPKHCRAAAVLR